LYALAVALVPLAATGFTSIYLGERALRQRIAEHQQAAAVAVAAQVSQTVEELAERLRTVLALVDVPQLAPDERAGLLRLLYRQKPEIGVALLVAPTGVLLAPPVFLARPGEGDLFGHPAATEEDAARAQGIVTQMQVGKAAVGVALISPVLFTAEAARLVVALPCAFDAAGAAHAIAAVELVLRREIIRVDGIATGIGSHTFVVDPKGRIIADANLAPGTDVSANGAVAQFMSSGGRGSSRYRGERGPQLGTFAAVGELGWGIVVEQPEAMAFAGATQMRHQTLGWIFGTLLLVLGSGIIFADRLRRTLLRLVQGAQSFASGRLDHRIELAGADELAELAGVLNGMAGALATSRDELQGWNQTLEQRVAERSDELKKAQTQLLTQAKLVALGQLGAGVAHEINNPLAAILGYTELLLDGKSGGPGLAELQKIRAAAERCKVVTMNLLRFSERRLAGPTSVQLTDIVGEVLDLMQEALRQAGVVLHRNLATNLPSIRADAGQLGQVLINLVTNARQAMPTGGELRVATETDPAGVALLVGDTGRGIEPAHLDRIFEPFFTTKDVWTGVGLGLSVAYRIVTDHGGTISVDSTVGKGSTFRVCLPREPPRAAANWPKAAAVR
ncbi:MAG: ATP-binding protein, partial [Myxococcota bacterium]